MSIDNFGLVRIDCCDNLSEQDLQDIKKEYELYLEFDKKFEACRPFL